MTTPPEKKIKKPKLRTLVEALPDKLADLIASQEVIHDVVEDVIKAAVKEALRQSTDETQNALNALKRIEKGVTDLAALLRDSTKTISALIAVEQGTVERLRLIDITQKRLSGQIGYLIGKVGPPKKEAAKKEAPLKVVRTSSPPA